MSDSGSNVSSVSRMRISSDSHLTPIDRDHLKAEAVSLSKDSNSKNVFRNSWKNGFLPAIH